MKILNELALVDEAFDVSKDTFKPNLPVDLKLRTHLQRALIFETGMNRESCSDELNTAEFIFRNYPQLNPENYHRIKNNLAVTLSLVGFQLDETLNVLYKHKFKQLYHRCHGAAARRNGKKGRIVL